MLTAVGGCFWAPSVDRARKHRSVQEPVHEHRSTVISVSICIYTKINTSHTGVSTPTQHRGAHPCLLGGTASCSQNGFKYYKDQEDEKKNFQPITDPRGNEQLAGASDPLSCCRAPSQPPPWGCYAKCHTAQNSPGSSFHLSLMGIPKPQRDSLENVPNLYLTKKCQVPEQRQSSKERRFHEVGRLQYVLSLEGSRFAAAEVGNPRYLGV